MNCLKLFRLRVLKKSKTNEEHVYESYIYTISSNGINIKSYHGEETAVVIPSEIDGKPVIAINNSAFAKNTSIVSVTIPASIKTIGTNAFSECSSLEKVTVNEGLTVVSGIGIKSIKSLPLSDRLFQIIQAGNLAQI